MDTAEPVNRLIEQFKKLPGIGTKSAQRLAFFVLKMETASATEFAETILEVKRTIRRCSICNNLTDVDPCQFCTAPARSDKALCVVEESNDILPVEKTHTFNGRYHVLMGTLSPMKGVTPDQLAINSLLQRLQSEVIEEVIVATNPNAEGETTALVPVAVDQASRDSGDASCAGSAGGWRFGIRGRSHDGEGYRGAERALGRKSGMFRCSMSVLCASMNALRAIMSRIGRMRSENDS